ncbi:crosslink repair DNA glycosylase YcaQ family protein [Streptosporangium canum]|uniref:DNA glycosylase AlkZ-like family protein n=1 Tax=Streptosporangium canum TaxID=324952 RepID=UPI00341303D6
MRITAQRLNRATLARQLLLRRQPLGVVDAVRRVVALQAQQPASPYLALWNRLTAFDPADLDVAFAGRGPGAPRVMRRCPPQAAVVRAAPRSPRPAAWAPGRGRGRRQRQHRAVDGRAGAAAVRPVPRRVNE